MIDVQKFIENLKIEEIKTIAKKSKKLDNIIDEVKSFKYDLYLYQPDSSSVRNVIDSIIRHNYEKLTTDATLRGKYKSVCMPHSSENIVGQSRIKTPDFIPEPHSLDKKYPVYQKIALPSWKALAHAIVRCKFKKTLFNITSPQTDYDTFAHANILIFCDGKLYIFDPQSDTYKDGHVEAITNIWFRTCEELKIKYCDPIGVGSGLQECFTIDTRFDHEKAYTDAEGLCYLLSLHFSSKFIEANTCEVKKFESKYSKEMLKGLKGEGKTFQILEAFAKNWEKNYRKLWPKMIEYVLRDVKEFIKILPASEKKKLKLGQITFFPSYFNPNQDKDPEGWSASKINNIIKPNYARTISISLPNLEVNAQVTTSKKLNLKTLNSFVFSNYKKWEYLPTII